MTAGHWRSKVLRFLLASAALTCGAALTLPATAHGAASGPVTAALHDVVVVQGSRATLAYRVDDPTSATATVTVVIVDSAGAVAGTFTLPTPVPTGTDLTFVFRCALAPGAYRFHVDAVDEAGLPQVSATRARLKVLPIFPRRAAIDAAIGWLKQRRGAAGLAVIDDRGHVAGCNLNRQFASASVVKAMLLVRYLRTHPAITSATRARLARMIIVSDNAAASAVFKTVGERGLRAFAALVGMTHFAVHSNWALARITALDQARLFYAMDAYVPKQYRTWVRYLFSHITPAHQWGVPEVAKPAGWRVFFKGGYMPVGGGIVVHEACRLERHGVVFALVVLTGGHESEDYGAATLRGVAARVLGVSSSPGRGLSAADSRF
jgi:hypothetical protein